MGRHWKLKEDSLDRIACGTRFGRRCWKVLFYPLPQPPHSSPNKNRALICFKIPAYPSEKNCIKIKLSVERWRDDTEGAEVDIHHSFICESVKTLPSSSVMFILSQKLWDSTTFSAPPTAGNTATLTCRRQQKDTLSTKLFLPTNGLFIKT